MSKTIITQELGELEMIGALENYTTPVVVDKSVLTRLANLLPSVPYYTIKNRLRDTIRDTSNVSELVKVLQEELSFHLSVNQILEVTPEEPKAVGKIDLEKENFEEFIV